MKGAHLLMASLLFLPDPAQLALVDIEVDEVARTVTATAVTTAQEAACPLCQHAASRIHSRYVRRLSDLSCSGRRVRWLIQVRCFRCENEACPRKIFTERLPTCAPPYARRTAQQAAILCELAFALGGKAGERIVKHLAMPTSHDTLLRLMSRSGKEKRPTPRVLGVDDFAWKKGDRYGTILIDQETHTVVDLLPDREADTFARWLAEHPGVEVISRDRAGAYADGARRGAPHAIQVSDRFHLLVNLKDALTRLFERKQDSLKRLAETLAGEAAPPSAEAKAEEAAPIPPKHLTPTEAQCQGRRVRRKDRYEQVLSLHEQGASQVAIAALVGLHRDTVRRYLAAPAFPEIVRPGHASKLDPYKEYLEQRWMAGQQNVTHLIAELRERGYRGSSTIVHDYLRSVRGQPEWRAAYLQQKQYRASKTSQHPLSARSAAWLFVCPPRQLKLRQVRQLDPLRRQEEELERAYQLAQDFRAMITLRQRDWLGRWLDEAKASGIPEFRSLATGIYRDYDAVCAALTTSYSNGQTEAQVHRLKLIKRLAYGRASFELLRLRVLHGSGVPDQKKCV
jgi:transposase